MKKSLDFAIDDHPDDDERPSTAWSVAVADDCDSCGDVRVEITFEERGQAGAGVIAHLAPASARRMRAAIAAALREVGEDAGR